MTEYRLKNWFCVPHVIQGNVYGNPKFNDGTYIHTSGGQVDHIDGYDIVYRTKNSVYRLNIYDHIEDLTDLKLIRNNTGQMISDKLEALRQELIAKYSEQ